MLKTKLWSECNFSILRSSFGIEFYWMSWQCQYLSPWILLYVVFLIVICMKPLQTYKLKNSGCCSICVMLLILYYLVCAFMCKFIMLWYFVHIVHILWLLLTSYELYPCLKKPAPLWYSGTTSPKQTSYQWLLAERIVIHLPLIVGGKFDKGRSKPAQFP